jgi:hypothetical protein
MPLLPPVTMTCSGVAVVVAMAAVGSFKQTDLGESHTLKELPSMQRPGSMTVTKTVVLDVVGLTQALISPEHTPFIANYIAKGSASVKVRQHASSFALCELC